MSTPHNHCPDCGAPSAPFAPEVTNVTCTFCGTPFAVHHPDALRILREKEAAERAEREKTKKEEKARAKAKENAAGCAVPIVVVGLIGSVIGTSVWYENCYKPMQWDGHHDFTCKSGEVTFTELQATGDIDARGTCVVNLVKPSFESHVKVREHAVVTITGGRIHDSSGTVLSVEGFGKVVLKGTTLDGTEAVRVKGSGAVESQGATILGTVKSDSPSELVNFPPPAASASAKTRAAAASSPQSTDRLACNGVSQCLQPWSGKFAGKATITIDASGAVKKSSVTGTQTPAIKACLVDFGTRNAATAAAQGLGAGNLVCNYSGTRDGFITQMSTSGSFVRAPP